MFFDEFDPYGEYEDLKKEAYEEANECNKDYLFCEDCPRFERSCRGTNEEIYWSITD